MRDSEPTVRVFASTQLTLGSAPREILMISLAGPLTPLTPVLSFAAFRGDLISATTGDAGISMSRAGARKTGQAVYGERGSPWIGKPPAFCAMQDRKSAESFARSFQGRIHSGPERDIEIPPRPTVHSP